MTECNRSPIAFSSLGKRKVVADFAGGTITSDGGVLAMGASMTPRRSRRTRETLLREMERLSEDLTEEELARAKILIVARRQTRGELTRVRASEIAEDLFYFGQPRERNEETARIERVTLDDIRNYLAAHPRNPDQLSVVTLGPAAQPEEKTEPTGSATSA